MSAKYAERRPVGRLICNGCGGPCPQGRELLFYPENDAVRYPVEAARVFFEVGMARRYAERFGWGHTQQIDNEHGYDICPGCRAEKEKTQ